VSAAQESSDPEHLSPSAWRIALVRFVSRLPAPVRRRIWRSRRALARSRRRRRESKGDFSRSRPALHQIDRRIEPHLPAEPGFFVEAGANDGFQQSNTYALERIHGWRGVLVEPVPELAHEAERERAVRVFNCALVAQDFPDPALTLCYGGLMTVVAGARPDGRDWVAAAHAVAQEEPEHEFAVPARTLSSILDEIAAPGVDLMSLDVEGYEREVLRGIDFERHAPRLLIVEARDAAAQAAIEAVLGARYVLVERFSPIDLLYARVD
jgi:FkbM family methyltransferase